MTEKKLSPKQELKLQLKYSPMYAKWRSDVLVRDKWTCQTCGVTGVSMDAHHQIGFSILLDTYNIKNINEALTCKELWDIKNGKTLCSQICHPLTDNYKNKGNHAND